MKRSHGLLVLLTLVALLAAGGVTTLSKAPQSGQTQDTTALASVPASIDAKPAPACSDEAQPNFDDRDANKPGCCTTQCNVDKDCDRICGKGVCACIQETPCCRRCVY